MRKLTLLLSLLGLSLTISAQAEEEAIDFYNDIYPFVKSGCVKCHMPPYEDERGRTRKPKADIILSTKAGILESKDEEDNLILVPGDADASRMYVVTTLPIDDDYHFPPEGKNPQWTDAEKELFAKWVNAGADFGDWVEDEAPSEGLEWDGEEKEAGTTEKWKPETSE